MTVFDHKLGSDDCIWLTPEKLLYEFNVQKIVACTKSMYALKQGQLQKVDTPKVDSTQPVDWHEMSTPYNVDLKGCV